MIPVTLTVARQGILRYSRWDALLIVLALAHGALLVIAPLAPVIALALWWNSNTISHHFIHKPFFRVRPLNTLFALYLSVLLAIPQSIWRSRHLAHHAGAVWRPPISRRMIIEIVLVLSLWATLLALNAKFFLTVYLPGYVVGLVICALHGHYEHRRGTISHYGIVYNLLFFDDGYHVEHHAHPGTHWTRLPERVQTGAETSRWPAVLRWLDGLSLEMLERCVLCSTEGPGQALIVNPKGEVKPCCGFASDLDQLTIGNIYTDSVARIVRRARRHPYVGKVFRQGLTAIRDEILARDPHALPGVTSNHCYFCWYVLTRGLASGVSGGGGQIGAWTGVRPNYQGELIQLGIRRRRE